MNPDVHNTPPLQPGWRVSYRGPDGRLVDGIIERCEPQYTSFIVHLVDGQRLKLRQITGVGKTDVTGAVIAAWTTEAHGPDGERGR